MSSGYHLRQKELDLALSDFLKACGDDLDIACKNSKIIKGYEPTDKVEYFLEKAVECHFFLFHLLLPRVLRQGVVD